MIENRGRTLKSMLQKSNPTATRKCQENECMVCKNDGKGDCKRENVTYRITCKNCKKVYIGETSKNAYTRGQQHQRLLQNKDKQSVLYRHIQLDHKLETNAPKFEMSVLQTHKTALCRQITEAVKINNIPKEKIINNKTEWGHTKILRNQMTYD